MEEDILAKVLRIVAAVREESRIEKRRITAAEEVENYSWITDDDAETESVKDDSENESGAEDDSGNESVGGEVVSASVGADAEIESVNGDVLSDTETESAEDDLKNESVEGEVVPASYESVGDEVVPASAGAKDYSENEPGAEGDSDNESVGEMFCPRIFHLLKSLQRLDWL